MADAVAPAETASAQAAPRLGLGDPPVLRVTEVAVERILSLRDQEEDPASLGLRVEVTGVHGVEYSYDLSFDPVADRAEGDWVSDQGGLPVVVPAASVDKLRGATLDVPSDAVQGGLVLRNPNRPDPLAGADLELEGSIEDKINQLLAQRINPALAAHGGYAQLERVEGDVVYVTMGGGCQGCAVSAMTLREGIARSIRQAIPEVSDVVDVTDHDAGENPFY